MSSEFLSSLEVHPILGIPVEVEIPLDQEKIGFLASALKKARRSVPLSIKRPLIAVRSVATGRESNLPFDKTINFGQAEAIFHITRNVEICRLKPDYERRLTARFLDVMSERKLENRPTIFANIGAAEGRYTVLGGKFADHTYAFEPDPFCFEALCKNLALNKLGNCVSPSESALDSRDGMSEFFVDSKAGFQAASLRKTSILDTKYPVYTRRLDSLCSSGMQVPDVVMIDVEGAEERVLKGFGKIRPQHLFLEVHPELIQGFGSSANDVLSIVKSMGYIAKMAVSRETELQIHYELQS